MAGNIDESASEADKFLTASLTCADRAAAELARAAPTDMRVAVCVAKAYELLREARRLNAGKQPRA